MQKWAGFDTYWGPGWPDEKWLEPFFLTPAGRRSFRERGCDSASLTVRGLYGTQSRDRDSSVKAVCIEWIRDTDLPPGTWPDPGLGT